jgi:tetratricopeptide (TPR) repeat protein
MNLEARLPKQSPSEFPNSGALSKVAALTNAGASYLAEQRFDEAVRAFEKAIAAINGKLRSDQVNSEILACQYVGLGAALVGLYKAKQRSAEDLAYLSAAKSAYVRAIEEDPRNAIAHSNLAAVYAELGRTDDAEREMLTAVQLDPEDQVARASFDSMIADRYSSMAEDGAKEQRTREGLRLLGSLLEGDDEEQRETFAFLKQALEEDRLSNRKRFTE